MASPPPPRGVLRIPRALLDAAYAHARAGAPEEVCGILAGTREEDAHVVHRLFPVRNAHPRPRTEFLLDPTEQLRATLEAEDDLGMEVVGFYHSHPEGPERLSATDAARATWPGASYLLIHLQPSEGHLSARWDDVSLRFRDEPVELVDDGPKAR